MVLFNKTDQGQGKIEGQEHHGLLWFQVYGSSLGFRVSVSELRFTDSGTKKAKMTAMFGFGFSIWGWSYRV